MNLKYELTEKDFRAFTRIIACRIKNINYYLLGFAVLIGFLLGYFDIPVHWPSVFGTLIFYIVYFLIKSNFILPQKGGVILAARTIAINPEGISEISSNFESKASWQAIVDIIETKSHIFLLIDNNAGFIIPKRCFDNSDQMNEFKNLINQHRQLNKQ